jgi:hypothetical protein
MRETPDAGRKRIDLNVPQVAGGALAAVVAAKLASYFGVYGTILGAGVVSVVATCGGTVFQHFFKRTGEQLKERSTVPVRLREQRAPSPGAFGETGGIGQSGQSGRLGEFGEGTVYRARVKSRRRPVLAAAVVFGVTMAGITGYELVSGSSFTGGNGTTMSDAVTGRHSSPSKSGTSETGSPDLGSSRSGGGSPASPSSSPSGTPGGQRSGSGEGASQGATPTPGDSAGTGSSDAPSPSATPTPGTSAATPTPPEPSASSRSGTAAPDRGGPAAP